jgi:hypothetical protein
LSNISAIICGNAIKYGKYGKAELRGFVGEVKRFRSVHISTQLNAASEHRFLTENIGLL